jgi:REP element-mobilizing transposase RayT
MIPQVSLAFEMRMLIHIHMNTFPFQFYHPNRRTQSRRRRLPHKEQRGVCYFVTMTLQDAMPKAARERLDRMKREWLVHHSEQQDMEPTHILANFSDRQRQRFQRFASTTYHKALDRGAGACPFRDPANAGIVAEALLYHDANTCILADAVVMPNHVHVILQPNPERDLKSTLNSIRTYSARRINQRLNRQGRLWAHEPFDHMVRSRHHFHRYQAYIQANPARAKLREGEYWLKCWEP